ncbi:hypothetical protein K504DRAFT_507402 [Pleomassaria siparia CBS 279.74]|uniref:MFS general substrate transporter n=1 Tax=Pleomassaria siparia CBS 279.74 TaxID=1314801 RepID=A0A6G1JTD8_9PLEO|nr:hypothetical protein K504DRAFT_507402 [Pleomassaria siparia CBS 279.74]
MSTDEDSALLASNMPPTSPTPRSQSRSQSRSRSRSRSQGSTSSTLPISIYSLWPLLLLLVVTHMGHALYALPLSRVIELRLCQEHYAGQHNPSAFRPDGSIPEKMCKVDDVQRQLAWLTGIMETTNVVCDFMVTIPFSFVAERWGIRVVLWCNLVPRIFASVWALLVGNYHDLLPTKAIVASPFLAVLGGDCVFSSTIFALTSSLAQEYVQRASYFSYASSTSYVVSFIGPTLASFTMSRNLWLPFWIHIVLLLLAIPTISLVPGTGTHRTRKPPAAPEAYSDDDAAADEEAGPLLSDPSPSPSSYANAFESKRGGAFPSLPNAVGKLVRLVLGRGNFQILLVSFFLTALASSDTKLLVQYISKRYEWTFAQAGYMLSAKALVNIVLLTIVVPRIIRSSLSSKTVHGSEVRLNYLGAEASIAVSVIGVLCVALAFKFWMLLGALVIYAMGSALPVFTMSLVKSPLIAIPDVDMQDFSIVILTKTLGSLVGAPLMTLLWVHAIELGGMGLGLPFFVSATD